MAKSDPEAQRKSSLSDCTWLKNEFGSFNYKTLKFLKHFREPGSSLYFIFSCFLHIYIYIYFFFLFFILIFFFLYFFSLFFFFLFALLELKNCIVPTSSPMLRRLLVLGQRGDRDKVGTRNIFPLERYLKYSILAPSCDLP
jgi:hypothetical protein